MRQGAWWKVKDDSHVSENISRHFIASSCWKELEALLYDVRWKLRHMSTKHLNRIPEILGFKCEHIANLMHDEAIEVYQNGLGEQDEEEPDVLYPGTT